MSEDRITARWRKPVIPLAVTDEPTRYTILNDREVLEISARFSKEDIERFRLGYCCINCWEPHESPFPEKCSLCSFPMKAKQMDVFLETFRGLQRDPRAVRIEEGLDRVDDTHERRFNKSKSGIIVPRPL